MAVYDTYTPMAHTYSVAGKNLEVSRRVSGRIQQYRIAADLPRRGRTGKQG